MAKPLGPKSTLIRQAITGHPKMGNKEIAEMLMDSKDRKDDKIKVTPQDVAQQRQQMKKAGQLTAGQRKGGAPDRQATASTPAPSRPSAPPAISSSPVDVIDKTLDLAQQCGGIAALKKLVDRLATMGG